MAVREFDRADLIDLAHGAAFLGSGGGGPLKTAAAMAAAVPVEARLQVIDVEDAPTDGLAVVVADMGAPDAMTSTSAEPMVAACDRYAADVGKPTRALVPIEVGALNSIVPCMVALAKGLPVVDCDGAGRAVPSLTMLTYSGYDVPSQPAVLADGKEQAVSLWTRDAAGVETLARPVLAADFGQQAGLAMWGMDKTLLAHAAPSRGTLDLARRVGRALRSSGDPVASALAIIAESGRPVEILARGILQEPEETTANGFDYGRITLRDPGVTVTVYNQNENLMAWANDRAEPLATAPDSICYVTPGGRTFSNADIDDTLIGEEVFLVRVRAIKALWTLPTVMEAFASALRVLGYAGPLLDTPLGAAQRAPTEA